MRFLFVLLLVPSIAIADDEKLSREEMLEAENIALSQRLLKAEVEKLQADITTRGKELDERGKALEAALKKAHKLGQYDKADFAKGVVVRGKAPEKKPEAKK